MLSKPGAQVVLHCILGHVEDDFIDSIKDGPEPNMPEIKVETVVPVSEHVNFSEDFKIIDVRKTTEDDTSNEIIKEEE